MEDGFKLLSKDYLKKYEDTNDTASVKFATKNWVDGEVVVVNLNK